MSVVEKVKLVVLGGPMDGLAYDVDRQEMIIGRLPNCDVFLPWDGTVSRKHARLIYEGHAYWLEDMGSTYGTFVGKSKSELQESARIQPGTIFRLGPVTRLKLKRVVEDTQKAERRFIWRLSGLVKILAERLPDGCDSLSPEEVDRFKVRVAEILGRLDAVSDIEALLAVLRDLSAAVQALGLVVAGPAPHPAGLPVDQCRPKDRRGLESLKSFFKSKLTKIVQKLDG